MGEVEDGKICAFLAYLFPIGLIWYLADAKMKKNKFVAFHVYQSLAAAIVLIIGQVIVAILSATVIGLVIAIPLGFLLMIAGLVWFIQGLIYSLGGQKKNLLFLGKLASKFNF